jgi:hypothetical protein
VKLDKAILMVSDADLQQAAEAMFQEMIHLPHMEENCEKAVRDFENKKHLFYCAWLAGAMYMLHKVRQGRLIGIADTTDRGPGG